MKEKVNVTGVPETMVQTLYARAKETRRQNAAERKRKADPDRDGNLFLDPCSSCGCYGAGVNRGDMEHAGIYEG